MIFDQNLSFRCHIAQAQGKSLTVISHVKGLSNTICGIDCNRPVDVGCPQTSLFIKREKLYVRVLSEHYLDQFVEKERVRVSG